ncbi:unnamed protein product [Eruca vesicaria subsp. sativa]|uniref:Fe2OG dioxygenase domain-containing protein n=1 Tax=Eruca vesicaria subsp. sativa TaxID=29727 RepID=A0ABC8JH56_ERUVS|nr:unnamed protein product [Eruca vesicaria subsp. sativa]
MTTTTNDVREFVVSQRNGVKGLVDSQKLTTLSSPYIQPPQERLSSDKILSSSSSPVPVIDVSNWDDPRVASEICDASAKLGLFQIVNHGIAPAELTALVAAARGFFELPVEERRRYWRGSSVSETAWLTTSFNPYKESVLEWRDFIKFEFLPQRHGFAATWPPVCKEQVTDHFKKMKPIANKILNILINNLNSTINESCEQTLMGTTRMNFNYYPECPDPSLAVGAGRHSDINTLTLLLQEDGVLSSLYARATEDGEKWINVPPIQGAIVVNIGDVLQIMSNDRYRSVEHCVLVNKSCSRVSIPVFYGPVNDSVIEPLPEVLEENNEMAKYKKVVYSDYLKGFFERAHDGKTNIESIKL